MPRKARDNQDYQHHPPSSSPWWEGVTPADGVRYERARRLSQFAREVGRGETTMMRKGRLEYRRQCIERWRDYLEGWTPRDEVAG